MQEKKKGKVGRAEKGGNFQNGSLDLDFKRRKGEKKTENADEFHSFS